VSEPSRPVRRLLVLPGDGIGPEVMDEALRVLERLRPTLPVELEIETGVVGGAAIDACGQPLPVEVLDRARASDAVLFGAVGGPKWEGLGFDLRPEMAILGLRSGLGLFANLRPASVTPALLDASPLKPAIARMLDVMIVREATGGIYFGEPRGIEVGEGGRRRGFNTESYATEEIERVARVAFEIARGRRGRVTSVEKANVMESGLVWRETVQALAQREFPDIALDHMYADNCAMQLARDPGRFDVIVTTNLFGDILSDLAGALTGSLGLLPSATVGEIGAGRRGPSLYEPIHGSAPDIAGRGLANPLAQILSLALLLRWALGLESHAAALEGACATALASGARTPDLGGNLSTRQMGDVVLAALDGQAIHKNHPLTAGQAGQHPVSG
jgi:3-isopropylmalate dehydrogenase